MLEQTPTDAFLLYAAAMEHRKAGNLKEAVALFDRCIVSDPTYCYAYYHKGQTLEEFGDADAAKDAYRAGIEQARRIDDAKALSELQTALDDVA
jgi:tetratricopeptide (TPR) repeat protein